MIEQTDEERIRVEAELVSAYVDKVIKKMLSGEYATEPTKCFCGADSDTQITTTDRYGLPHRIVVCNECALMRANPRMTAESYKKFYNNEYMEVHKTRKLTSSITYEKEVHRGELLLARMDEFAIDTPKVVVDFGCHDGGMLKAFQDAGATAYGVEIDTKAADIARNHSVDVVTTSDQLIERGVKADLIIMQDVIEHLTDLHELDKIAKLLKPGGYLYVWTPGFFRADPNWYFQLAHTYQFCARTLEYVMNSLGYTEVYTDEDIESFWQYTGPQAGDGIIKPTQWVEYITDSLYLPANGARKLPRFRGVCKFSPKLLYENVEANLANKMPDLYEITGKFAGDLVVIGGGPSVDGQVDTIKQLQRDGAKVVVIARMYPWCATVGLVPDFVVSLDCMEEQERSFDKLQSGVIYLLASVTRPSICKMLSAEKCYIFDSKESLKMHKMRWENGYRVATVINGGGCVTITCLSLGMNLGFKNFHVFGLDLKFQDREQTHATGIAGTSLEQNFIEVEIGGEIVLTTASFCDFAQQTLDLVGAGHEDGLLDSIKFYGDSIMTRLWDCQWHEVEVANEPVSLSA